MDERDQILEAVQDGLDSAELAMSLGPEKTGNVFDDPEQTALFRRVAEEFHGGVKVAEAVASGTPISQLNSAEECSGPEHSEGGCATCGFRCSCGRASFEDIMEKRKNGTAASEPLPPPTFPMPQVLAAVAACVVGCYFAQKYILLWLGR